MLKQGKLKSIRNSLFFTTNIFLFLNTMLFAQSINGKLGTNGQFIIRDTTNTFLSLSQSTGSISLNRSIILPYSNPSGYGTIFKLTERFLHNYGTNCTFLGINSGNFTSTGHDNTGLGVYTLNLNTTGFCNVAIGQNSMGLNTTGSNCTAVGYMSLFNNTTALRNTALGYKALFENTTGNDNTALGMHCLLNNTTGYENTSVGDQNLQLNTSGFQNTALGFGALYGNTIGSQNTAVGNLSGQSITTGTNLTLIGYNSAPTTNTATNQITLGNNQVTSLRCNVTTITSLSDMRDKKNITDLSIGLDFITKLKPRQFNWDKREWYADNISDGTKTQETLTAGFIAQELDEAQLSQNAEWLNLVLKDNSEKLEATAGNLLPVMVKAIQELKSENDELKEKIARFEQMQIMLAGEIEKIKENNNEINKVKYSGK
jgi:trimeric autotransporter adhesin